MSYIVLARKYRPQTFTDIIGQNHISTILKNAVRENRIAHAYIFYGQRGTGKTTSARIFAKVLNCLNPENEEPCNTCSNCTEITAGSSMDVIEIDGASNRGIEEIRAIRDNVKFAPAKSKYKIYIIDEAHQITDAAFNALLKTLEEPPPHVLFILATTEYQKIPLTILSRCQRFTFRPISIEEISGQLKRIIEKEKAKVDDTAVRLISRMANGALRDSLSLLDQIISVSEKNNVITLDMIRDLLGLSPTELITSYVDIMAQQDQKKILAYVIKIAESGQDFVQFSHDLRDYLRKLVFTVLGNEGLLKDYLPEEQESLKKQKSYFDTAALSYKLELINKCIEEIKWSDNPQIIFELYSLRLLQKPAVQQVQKSGAATTAGSTIKPVNTQVVYQNTAASVSSKTVLKESVSVPVAAPQKTAEPAVIKPVVSEPKPVTPSIPAPAVKQPAVQRAAGKTLETINIPQIIETISKNKKPLMASYLETSAIEIKPNNILNVIINDKFAFGTIKNNVLVLEEILNSNLFMETPVKINVSFDPDAVTGKSSGSNGIEEDAPVDDMPVVDAAEQSTEDTAAEEPQEMLTKSEKELIQDPGLKKIVDLFHGKIIN